MSSALVRQALEFVDPDENCGKRKNRADRRADRPLGAPGQDSSSILRKYKKSKSSDSQAATSAEQVPEEVIARLLKLSRPILDKTTANKIVQRAARGPPADSAPPPPAPPASVLFPAEPR